MRFWIIPAGAIHWYVMHLYYKYCSILHTYKPSKSVSDTFVDFLKNFLHQATIGKILSIFWQTILLHKTIVKTNRTPILDYNWKSFFYLIIFNNMVDKIAELEWFEIYRGISVVLVFHKSRNQEILPCLVNFWHCHISYIEHLMHVWYTRAIFSNCIFLPCNVSSSIAICCWFWC